MGGVAVALVLASPASATFPGLNGSIAFLRYADGPAFVGIAAVDLSGGVVFHSPSPYIGPVDDDPAWSPDGRWLAFHRRAETRAGDGIYVVDAWGGHLRRLTRSSSDAQPSWSPSGDKIAYRGNQGIWVINADGTAPHRIFTGGSAPSWSPDGESIAFNNFGISLMRPDGSDVREILPTGANPRWAPDGSQLTYESANERLATDEVWVAGRDGSGARPITSGNTDLSPTWSPDGKWIAFSRQSFVGDHDFNIHRIRTDGTGLRRLTTGSDDLSVDWQPLRCTQTGTAGPDRMVGTPAPDVLCGQGGDDTLRAVGAGDMLFGSGGDDLLAGAGRALLFGESGNDRLAGGGKNDVLAGGFGADSERGGSGSDLLGGSVGSDVIRGGPGSDTLLGERGRDILFGGAGRDRLLSRDGQRDRLDGGPNRDCAIADRPRLDSVRSALRCTLGQLQGLVR